MSIIPCTEHCAHQQDGLCTLRIAAAAGLPDAEHKCLHYLPRDISSAASGFAVSLSHSAQESAPDPFEV